MWTRMNYKLGELERKLVEIDENATKVVTSMEKHIDSNLNRFKLEHDLCRQSVLAHHENTMLHMTQQERDLTRDWRIDVTKKLDRIEDMLKKANGI